MTATTIPTRAEVPMEETWNTADIFPTEASWEAAAVSLRPGAEAIVARRGSLGESVESLAAALDAQAALNETIEKLYIYALLRRDENTADATALERYERIATLATELGEMLAFISPEIIAIPQQQLHAWMDDPCLAQHRQNLHDLDRNRPHVRSAEIEALLAATYELARAPESAFTALDNADITFGTGHDEEGNEIELTKGRVARILQGRNRDARREAQEKRGAAYLAHQHTAAALYASAVRADVFYARSRGHATAREAALFGSNIPVAVYDALIAAVHDALPALTRYLDLRRRVLDVPQLAPYDTAVPLAELPGGKLSYREAIATTLEGLAPLGEKYLSDLRTGLERGRWVDVHETANKRGGGYNVGVFGVHPYILLNWNGSRSDLYTLAHEAGHAMHSHYSSTTQPYPTASYTIFTAEVASTVNETLLTWHLLGKAKDDAERFAVLAQFLDDVYTTLIMQTLYAEFEHWSHAQIESGAALTAENLTAEWSRLYQLYHPTIEPNDAARIGWARIPHFYSGFYVYQYATGLSAAIALAGRLRDEGAPAIERFLHFLTRGGADYSIELLKQAGVDMTTPEPVSAALAEFAARTNEAIAIFDTGVIPTHSANQG
jgi:oligoendopeptidase F